MSRIKLACLTAAAGLGAAAAIAGCGNDVPPNAVAKVGDSVIKTSDFDKWLTMASRGQSQGGTAVVPKPPDFTACVAAQQRQPPPQGGKKPTASEAKKLCKQQYDQLKGQVMQFLIQAQWVQQEANARGVKVSNAEVQRALEDQKKQAFPNEKAYRRFLASSGMNEQDILYRVRLDTLQTKLTQKVTENEGKVSDTDVTAYYNQNQKRFAQPERRDLRVVLTKTRPKAQQAMSQLRKGKSFKTVAKDFSIDDASKSQGGKLPDVAKGQQEKALDAAVFQAKKGKLSGPVKTQFGWYVFEVTKVTPASQQSLAKSKETIRNLLRSQRQQKALDAFIKDFRKKYKDKTTCAHDFRVSECKNGPKENTNTSPGGGGAAGGSPQGGQPQTPSPQTPTPQAPSSP